MALTAREDRRTWSQSAYFSSGGNDFDISNTVVGVVLTSTPFYVAAILLVTSLVFALQVTAVTPLSASTSSQHIENQQQAVAEGVLAAADADGALKPAVLFGTDIGNDGRFSFHETENDVFYTNHAPTNRFGAMLSRAFDRRGLAYNVYVNYESSTSGTNQVRMVYQGEPSDNAVAAQWTVTLYDDDRLYVPTDSDKSTPGERHCDLTAPTCATLENAGDNFYASDVGSGRLFNVVEVEVVVWRQ